MKSPDDMPGIAPANQRLLDAILTHAVDLERLKAGEIAGVVKLLTDLEAELIGKLATLPPPSTQSAEINRARLQALLQQTTDTINTAYRGIASQQADHAATLAGIEGRAAAGMIDTGIGIQGAASSVVLTRAQLVALADTTLITAGNDQAAPLADWWNGQAANARDRFAKSIQMGYAQGEDVDALVRRVRGTKAANYTDGVMSLSRQYAETLVRTSVQQISNAARQQTIDANRDLAGKLQHHSTLDGRTSGICRERDGKLWTNDDAHEPIGHALPFRVPPLHPRCRSVLLPVLKSWSELSGGKLKDLDASDESEIERRFRANLAQSGLSPEQQAAAMRNTRASMDGQVPDTITYPQWLQQKNKLNPGFGKRLLGTKRADLVSRGVISVSEAVSPMTLAQLDAKVRARSTESATPPVAPPLVPPFPSRHSLGHLGASRAVDMEEFTAAGIDYSGTLDQWNSTFRLSPAKFVQRVFGGMDVDLTKTSISADYQSNRETMMISARGKLGSGGAFRLERSFDMANKIAGHDFLRLSDDAQDQGFTKKLFGRLVPLYDHMGLESIHVHANIDVGGYAWARYGFLPSDSSAWSLLRSDIRSRWQSSALRSQVNPATAARVDAILASDDVMGLRRIAGVRSSVLHGGVTTTLGKVLLLDTDWQGALDLTDPSQYGYLRNYLARNSS